MAPAQDSGPINNFLSTQNAINVPPTPPCPDYNNDGRPDTWADYYASRHDGFLCTIGLARRSLPFSVAAIAIFGLVVWRTRRRR